MAHVLELRAFGFAINGRPVIKTIDLDVADRGVVVVLGPSGTGKSTLLRTLAGLNSRNPAFTVWGEARYQGRPLFDGDAFPALVVQKAALMVATVLEALASGLPNRSSLTRLEQIDRIKAFCGAIGQDWVGEKIQLSVAQLPFHEQRALSIIREILSQPALLLLDEPTANMADPAADFICRLIGRISESIPVVMVSHNQVQTRRLAKRVVLIANGVVQENRLAEDFFHAPSTESGRIFLKTGSCPEVSREADEAHTDAEAAPVDALSEAVVGATDPLPASVSHFMGPRGFVWLLPGLLAGTPWPGIIHEVNDDLAALKMVGISQLVSLTERPFPEQQAAAFGMNVLHFPIPDMDAPSIAAATGLCRELDRLLAQGERIAIHCKAGLGRTGTLLAAYWLWTNRGASAGQAIAMVRRLNGAMIQSSVQTDFISEFADSLAGLKTPSL